jgi:hypothetical protein
MNNEFANDELEVGKLLVLAKGHKLKIADIKSHTNATKVKKLIPNKDIEIDTFLQSRLALALDKLGEIQGYQADCYYIEGTEAVSSIIRLLNINVLATVEFNAVSLKQLHNCILRLLSIELAQRAMAHAYECHSNANEILVNSMPQNTFASNLNVIQNLANNYGVAEHNLQYNKLVELMKVSW